MFDERRFERSPPDRIEPFVLPHWSGGECFIAAYDRRHAAPRHLTPFS